MHGLRTEGNHTPLQLFNAGCLRLKNSGLEAMDLFLNVDDEYGIENSDLPDIDDDHEVCIFICCLLQYCLCLHY